MAIAYVGERGTDNNNGTTSSFTVTLTSNFTASNMAMIVGRYCPSSGSAGASVAITDSKGNTWTTDAFYQENFQCLYMATTRQDVGTLTSSDTLTVTMNRARSAGTPTIAWVEEFSGVATSSYDDGENTGAGSSTSISSGTVTPSTDGDLMVALIDIQSKSPTVGINNTGTVGTYSSFTTAQIDSVAGVARRVNAVYQVLATGSGVSQEHRWSLSSSQWGDRLIGAWKPAAGGGGPTLTDSVGVLES